jgi:hypothetical protein
MVIGSALVIFDVTGWLLAGLVSFVGGALIGLWLLAPIFAQRIGPESHVPPPATQGRPTLSITTPL